MKRIILLWLIISFWPFFSRAEVSILYNVDDAVSASSANAVYSSISLDALTRYAVVIPPQEKGRRAKLTYANMFWNSLQSGILFQQFNDNKAMSLLLAFTNYGKFQGYAQNTIEQEPGAAYTFGAFDLLFAFNYSVLIGQKWSIGASLLPVYRKIEKSIGYGIGISVGSYYKFMPSLGWLVSFDNFGPPFYIAGKYQNMPMALRTGFNYIVNIKGVRLIPGIVLNVPFYQSVHLNVGLSAELSPSFTLRLGGQILKYREIEGKMRGFSAGFTVNMKKYTVDYSYEYGGDFATNTFLQGLNRLDISLKF